MLVIDVNIFYHQHPLSLYYDLYILHLLLPKIKVISIFVCLLFILLKTP